MHMKQICAWVLRHPYSSSPSGQSKTVSQRSRAGIQLLFMQRYSPVAHPVWGGVVPGTTLAHISSSELSRQSTSPSQCQLSGIQLNRYKHWKWSLWHVCGMGVTGPEHIQKQNSKHIFNSGRDKNQKQSVVLYLQRDIVWWKRCHPQQCQSTGLPPLLPEQSLWRVMHLIRSH